jgi:hypothetical protein
VLAYVEAFLSSLKEKGIEEGEREKKEKGNKTNSQILPKNNLINDSTRRAINNLPLPAAKNFAKNEIRKLFKKYKPDLEKIKEV